MKLKDLMSCGNTRNIDIRYRIIINTFNCFLGFFTFGVLLFISGEVLQELGSSNGEQRFVSHGFYMILFGLMSATISIIYLIFAIAKYAKYKNERNRQMFSTQPYTISSDNNIYTTDIFPQNNDSRFDPPPPYSAN
jgi:hypothetical protein